MRQVVTRRNNARVKPLGEPALWVLLSLAEEPRHGYALMKDVERISDGRVRLSTGTMYGALRRLLDDGWIVRVTGADTARDKQHYALTTTGLEELRRELDHLRLWTKAAAARLRTRSA